MTSNLPNKRTLSILAVATAALALPEASMAQATVAWGAAQNTVGPSDVAPGGAVVEARNGLIYSDYLADVPAADTTVAGVLFDGINFLGAQFPNEPADSFIGSKSSGDFTYDTLIGNVTSCDAPTLGNGSTQTSANYQIQGLTNGVEYLVQVWYTDVRPISNAREITIDGAVTLLSGQSSVPTDLGQYTIGTFTASGTTQLVNFDTAGTSGRAGISAIMVRVNDGSGLGTNYCGPAVANSTGSPAALLASGSRDVVDNDVTLMTVSMPANAFGFFITSQTQGFAANPGGSAGNLCLGGSVGRDVGPGQILNSGPGGSISIAIDLTNTPQPNGSVSVAAGETWNFQTWFRDTSSTGTPTSNFSDGLQIDFQ